MSLSEGEDFCSLYFFYFILIIVMDIHLYNLFSDPAEDCWLAWIRVNN